MKIKMTAKEYSDWVEGHYSDKNQRDHLRLGQSFCIHFKPPKDIEDYLWEITNRHKAIFAILQIVEFTKE